MNIKFSLLLVVCSLAITRAGIASNEDVMTQTIINLIAEAVNSRDCTVILGRISYEDSPQSPETRASRLASGEPDSRTLAVLGLTRVYVEEVIRSADKVPPILYLQWNIPEGMGKHPRWSPSILPSESAKLMFLVHPKRLCNRILQIDVQGSEIQNLVRQNKHSIPPVALFEKIGCAGYLNKDSWVEGFQDEAVFETAIPAHSGVEQTPLSERQKIRRSRAPKPPFILPAEFVSDLKRILARQNAAEFDAAPAQRVLATDLGKKLHSVLLPIVK